MVAVQSKVFEHQWYPYAVTNSHVIREGNATIIRVNTADGGFEVVETEQGHWFHHPDGDDIAVCPMPLPQDIFKYRFISRTDFLTHDIIAEHNIGPGDDVFMVGRFVGHDGKQRNTPSLRFGNIAMMPLEPIRHERGYMQESFLVEARSIPGYSGSPVFVQILPLSHRPGKTALELRGYGPWLLGIDWCHLRVNEPVRKRGADDPVITEGWFVHSNSGMMGVIPVWKLEELLDIEPLRIPRERSEQSLMEEKARSNIAADTKQSS